MTRRHTDITYISQSSCSTSSEERAPTVNAVVPCSSPLADVHFPLLQRLFGTNPTSVDRVNALRQPGRIAWFASRIFLILIYKGEGSEGEFAAGFGRAGRMKARGIGGSEDEVEESLVDGVRYLDAEESSLSRCCKYSDIVFSCFGMFNPSLTSQTCGCECWFLYLIQPLKTGFESPPHKPCSNIPNEFAL